jgi:hypothetical protein
MRRMSLRAASVFMLLGVVVLSGCERAEDMVAPVADVSTEQPRWELPVTEKLSARRINRKLQTIGWWAPPAEGWADPRRHGELMLSLEDELGLQHFLFVEHRSMSERALFRMELSSREVMVDGERTEVAVVDLTATSENGFTNDVGSAGFKRQSVALCLDGSAAGERPERLRIYYLADDGRLVPMQPLRGRMSAPWVCASIPHFSGFVMGAN